MTILARNNRYIIHNCFFLKSLCLKISNFILWIRKTQHKTNFVSLLPTPVEQAAASRQKRFSFDCVCVKRTRIINQLLKCEKTSVLRSPQPKEQNPEGQWRNKFHILIIWHDITLIMWSYKWYHTPMWS